MLKLELESNPLISSCLHGGAYNVGWEASSKSVYKIDIRFTMRPFRLLVSLAKLASAITQQINQQLQEGLANESEAATVCRKPLEYISARTYVSCKKSIKKYLVS